MYRSDACTPGLRVFLARLLCLPALLFSVQLAWGEPPVLPSDAMGHWVSLNSEAAFSPRDTAEGVQYGGRYWLSNGYYHGNVLSRDLWVSDDAVTWTLVRDATPYDGYSELVAYKEALWAIKGSVWRSVDGEAWESILSETPFGVRGYGEVVVLNDKMWQLGSGADVWSTTDGVRWEEVTAAAPYGKREAAAVTVFQNKLWLLGGKTPGANTPPEAGYADTTTHNDVWCSEDGKNWERVIAHAPWSPRQWFGVAVYRDQLWVIGGYDNVNNTNLGDVWHSKDGVTWDRVTSPQTFAPRHEPTVYVDEHRLLVVAGNTWPVVNDVWALLPPAAP